MYFTDGSCHKICNVTPPPPPLVSEEIHAIPQTVSVVSGMVSCIPFIKAPIRDSSKKVYNLLSEST